MSVKGRNRIQDGGEDRRAAEDMESDVSRASSAATGTTTSVSDQPVKEREREGRRLTGRERGRWCLMFLRRNVLLICLLISLGVGIGMGAGLKSMDPPMSKRDIMYFRFPGDLLMRMLKALIIPLIVSSLISGLAGLDAKASGKLGMYGIIYYMSTTLSAVLLGILLVCVIKPGADVSVGVKGSADPGNIADSFLDLIRNMFPDNLIEATFRQTKTYQVPVYGFVNETQEVNGTECNFTDTSESILVSCNVTRNVSEVKYYDFSIRKEDGMNVLGLVVYSVALGIVVGRLGALGRPLYLVCLALAEASMKLVSAVIWYSPIGIAFLIAAEIIAMNDPIKTLASLGLYMATVLTGLAIHGLIVLPLIYFVVVRQNPLTFLYGALPALITAFGTASSSATLPVTYSCLEERLRVDKRVTRFLLPVGATINMDGTALYEAVAAIFIAQSNGMQLNAAQIVATSITATLASIGAASVPQAGLVTMVIVLSALGLPAEEVTKIIAVDWLLDRFRTAVNVEGDSIGCGVIAHLCRVQLAISSESTLDPCSFANNPEVHVMSVASNNYVTVLEGGTEKLALYPTTPAPAYKPHESTVTNLSSNNSRQNGVVHKDNNFNDDDNNTSSSF